MNSLFASPYHKKRDFSWQGVAHVGGREEVLRIRACVKPLGGRSIKFPRVLYTKTSHLSRRPPFLFPILPSTPLTLFSTFFLALCIFFCFFGGYFLFQFPAHSPRFRETRFYARESSCVLTWTYCTIASACVLID